MTIMYPFCSYCQDVFCVGTGRHGREARRNDAAAARLNGIISRDGVSERNKVTGGGVSERVAREGRVKQGDADASRREDAADDGASERGVLQGEASEQNDIAARQTGKASPAAAFRAAL